MGGGPKSATAWCDCEGGGREATDVLAHAESSISATTATEPRFTGSNLRAPTRETKSRWAQLLQLKVSKPPLPGPARFTAEEWDAAPESRGLHPAYSR